MSYRDAYFFAAGLGTTAILVFGCWLYSEWRDYREWLEQERRGR